MEIKIICRRGFRLQTTQIFAIPRCHFAEDGYEMSIVLKGMCWLLFCPLDLEFCHVLIAVAVLVCLGPYYSNKPDETYPDANPKEAKTNINRPVLSNGKTYYSKDEQRSPKHHLCDSQPTQSSFSVNHDCDQIGDKSNIQSDAEKFKASKSLSGQPEGIWL